MNKFLLIILILILILLFLMILNDPGRSQNKNQKDDWIYTKTASMLLNFVLAVIALLTIGYNIIKSIIMERSATRDSLKRIISLENTQKEQDKKIVELQITNAEIRKDVQSIITQLDRVITGIEAIKRNNGIRG